MWSKNATHWYGMGLLPPHSLFLVNFWRTPILTCSAGYQSTEIFLGKTSFCVIMIFSAPKLLNPQLELKASEIILPISSLKSG